MEGIEKQEVLDALSQSRWRIRAEIMSAIEETRTRANQPVPAVDMLRRQVRKILLHLTLLGAVEVKSFDDFTSDDMPLINLEALEAERARIRKMIQSYEERGYDTRHMSEDSILFYRSLDSQAEFCFKAFNI